MAKCMEPLALVVAGALLAAAGLQAIAPARAQSRQGGDGLTRLINGLFSGQKADAPAAASGANGAVASGSIPWSGRDGASGDPLMTAAAIRQAAANFGNCIASLWPQAARRHISRENFERFTAGLSPDLHIMDLLDAQPEFTKPIWDYLDILVNDDRLAAGRGILAKYKPQFDATERAYGVDRYTIAAIWGIESNYSTQIGDRPVLQSTATLACIGRRQPYFREEFLSALEILNHGDLRPEQMHGSWAGAFGPTQFMPTAFKRYAVDADGDGRKDVVDDPADVIASTATNLKKDGWQTGQTWGYEVRVPQSFDYMLDGGAKTMTIAQWQRLGITRAAGQPFPHPAEKAFLLTPAGAEGPGFLMLRNFRVIMKYNPADFFREERTIFDAFEDLFRFLTICCRRIAHIGDRVVDLRGHLLAFFCRVDEFRPHRFDLFCSDLIVAHDRLGTKGANTRHALLVFDVSRQCD